MAKRVPPNLRLSKSCATCAHWLWGYEGEGECRLWPETRMVKRRKGEYAGEEEQVSNYRAASFKLCDDHSYG
ncbi:hypothetical protein [Ferrovibrio sp.]|uniref:hypothetical protein n=1 Tax=Ferrovibrio sp. TaxID=1917215 RepID=UPI0035B44335